MRAIADTGFLVAFAKQKRSSSCLGCRSGGACNRPVAELTCEASAGRPPFHLADSSLPLDFVRDGLVRPAFALGDHLLRLAELAARYADRQPDLADLCLIRLSELHPKFPVITIDVNDFRVYRRGRREAIPLIHPPQVR